jgi:uncharacterized protein YrrD
MILLGSNLKNAPIMSLQTGNEVGCVTDPLIDPADLSVRAYLVDSPLIKGDSRPILRIADVRELSDMGFIVDSIDEIAELSDVIKLQELADLNFHLVDMNVTDEKRSKLGKVVDFTLDTTTFTVQQLTVRRPLLKSFNDTELVIHRSQIIEINGRSIVVHSEAKVPEPELHEVVGSYVNPFRKTKQTAPESIDRTER